MRKLKLRVIMLDKTRLPWKQGKVPEIKSFFLNVPHLTYILSKQPAVSLYFDYFS